MSTRVGVVAAFDEAAGLGAVRDDGGDEHPFHCTEIADGSRTIAPGTRVRYVLLPKLGRWEAGAIEPLGP